MKHNCVCYVNHALVACPRPPSVHVTKRAPRSNSSENTIQRKILRRRKIFCHLCSHKGRSKDPLTPIFHGTTKIAKSILKLLEACKTYVRIDYEEHESQREKLFFAITKERRMPSLCHHCYDRYRTPSTRKIILTPF